MCPRSITGASHQQDLGAITETVKTSRGQERVKKNIRPLGGSAIARQYDAAFFVAAINDVVQVARSWRVQWLETKVIQHQQIGAQVGLQTAFISAIGPTAVNVLQHLGNGHEEGVKALPARFVDQSLRQVGFPSPGWAADQYVAVLAHEFTTGQL